MKHSRTHLVAANVSLLNVLAVALLATGNHDGSTLRMMQSQQVVGLPSSLLAMVPGKIIQTPEDRIAYRLQKRLYKTGKVTPPLGVLSKAVTERKEYFKRSVDVHVLSPDGKVQQELTISAHRNPLILTPEFSYTRASYHINTDAVRTQLENEEFDGATPPEDIVLTAMEKKDDILRAETSGVAKAGMRLQAASGAELISKALETQQKEVSVHLIPTPGVVINETGEDVGEMKLLAIGRSNFAGSTYARMQNVRKALRSHVNNTVVLPGETFSFNSTLGGPVTESRGWYMAKVIFEGDQLRYAPGGGICQASTTVYRAIVNAGFPVVERRAHSLYVSYYKEYGVGIDATIYPGSQDLVFLNDTEHPLLIQAYDDGYDAVVSIFGTPDGRSVELNGPYFTTNAPDELLIHNRKIAPNEIAWLQRVSYADGAVKENTILSRYMTLPEYVKREFTAPIAVIQEKTAVSLGS
ncbi:hypothetical protein COU76_02320 [Candidatus Peregrinibacteria bacterium CG10_big_fil_rev_8_21_14_0_10_49_10]|nr:MAG: hypothetical protein COU76_02320 [Candidatus Peregrinibacteria bacterium CG10_big_fil_rev_8_21_14_0_10_49_10]